MSSKNEMLPHIALNLAIFSAITWKYGILGGLFSITQATMCILMIEIVNYVEHYGLKRNKD
jgi:alkane 1-monooxygenase